MRDGSNNTRAPRERILAKHHVFLFFLIPVAVMRRETFRHWYGVIDGWAPAIKRRPCSCSDRISAEQMLNINNSGRVKTISVISNRNGGFFLLTWTVMSSYSIFTISIITIINIILKVVHLFNPWNTHKSTSKWLGYIQIETDLIDNGIYYDNIGKV